LDEQVGALGGLGATGVDDHQGAPGLERVVDEDGLMDVGLRRILPPHHNELGAREVRRIRVLVLSQSEPRRFEASRPAEIAIGCRIAAEESPEIVRHLVEKALRAACRVEENAWWSQRVTGPFELLSDGVEGLVPADARVLERPGSAAQRIEQPVRRVRPLDIAQAFETHAFGGGKIPGMRLEANDAAVLDVNASRTRQLRGQAVV